MRRPEPVLLVEERDGAITFRVVTLEHPITLLVERCHLSPTHTHERVWRCNGERAPSGQRIFREVLKPTPAEVSEAPVFDELVLKSPLTFQ